MRIFIINEHPDWLGPLGKLLDASGVPWQEWYVDTGSIDLDRPPPDGVFFNRMSASSHTRGHTHSVTHTRELVAWLESHGRRVLNGSRVLELEMSKARQHAALSAAGLRVPRTVAVIGGRDQVLHAARSMGEWPIVVKPNRGGKGLGVRLVTSLDQLAAHLESPDADVSPDGVTLLQQYIRAPEPFITRCEFVDGRFVYAIRSDTSDGFELCPADGCAPCAVGGKFALIEGFHDPVLEQYSALTRRVGLDVCGIEFIRDRAGQIYTYDINATTNYNARIEAAAPASAGSALVALLARELERASESSCCRATRYAG